jgi:hypothetical protein
MILVEISGSHGGDQEAFSYNGGKKHLWNVGKFYQTTRYNNLENSHLHDHGFLYVIHSRGS